MRRSLPRWLLALSLLAFLLPAQAGDLITKNTAAANSLEAKTETVLIKAISEIRANQIDAAIKDLEYLTKLHPDFKLAQLMYGDLLLARTRPITDFGQPGFLAGDRLDALREEAQARWQHFNLPPVHDKLPASLVQMSSEQRYVLVVDLKASRLYVYENSDKQPRLVDNFYVTIGKQGYGKREEGDQKTPIGVYFVTGHIAPDELPDLYGAGAFPIDYPNPWDQRQGYTGYGIWLHGTPSDTYSRPPRDSDGCVILSNQDFKGLEPYLNIGTTPVVLADGIEWIKPAKLKQRRQRFNAMLQQWRKDWESRNANAYLQHYSRDYRGLGMDYSQWVSHKRRVNPSKRYIDVGLSDTSMYLYPGQQDLLVVTFTQDYSSDSFQRTFRKRQYWRKEDNGRWRIIYEGNLSS